VARVDGPTKKYTTPNKPGVSKKKQKGKRSEGDGGKKENAKQVNKKE